MIGMMFNLNIGTEIVLFDLDETHLFVMEDKTEIIQFELDKMIEQNAFQYQQ